MGVNLDTSATPEQLVAMCNRCGHRWPTHIVRNEDGGSDILVALPCLHCGYAGNALVACDDEEVAPLGKIGTLEEFEAMNPGPVNLTERALEIMKRAGVGSIRVAIE